MTGDDALAALAAEVGAALLRAGRTVTTAESCTGGWIAKALTDVAGSSAWFNEGFVTYANAAKQRRLGVSAEVLARKGAVSREVVAAMARGALHAADADVAVAVSGVAGPDGGSADKPVGTVWVAWGYRDPSPAVATPGGAAGDVAAHAGRGAALVRTERLCFAGDRDAVRRATVERALRGLLREPPRST